MDASGAGWAVYVDGYGLGIDKAGTELRGDDLVGWTLVVDAANSRGTESKTYEVEVYAFEDLSGWNDGADSVPTYGLSVLDTASDTMVNVCSGFDLDMTSVVFLDRELYDLSSFGVDEGVDSFASTACRGHALAKMKLLHDDPDSPSFETSAEERLATLRMLTEDYCGDGTSHTWLGTRLDWTDQLGHVNFDSSTMSSVVEAEWSSDRALCLNTSRLGIVPVCDPPQPSLPACESPFSGSVRGGAVWVSMLPAVPQPAAQTRPAQPGRLVLPGTSSTTASGNTRAVR